MESSTSQEQVKKSFSSSRRLSCTLMNREESTGPSLSIPFTWESQPGTPKVLIHQRKLPPLTPPPSYFYCSPASTKKTKQTFLRSIFPRLRSRKTQSPESPDSSSSSSSWSSPWPSSVPASPAGAKQQKYQYRERVGEFEDNDGSSPSLCFGLSRGGNNPRSRGCYLAMIKVLQGST